MASIEEMQAKMTLYYSKRTGDIKSYCTGINDMSYFGDNLEDYIIIWDYIVLERDNNVINNIKNFKINVETKQLEMKPDAVPQYPIAAQ